MICSQTMAAMIMSDPAKKVEVTLCPPSEQEVFFQEAQFDEKLGAGIDPQRWEDGKIPSGQGSPKRTPEYGREVLKSRLKRAEKALEGHENKEEIMKVLRRGVE